MNLTKFSSGYIYDLIRTSISVINYLSQNSEGSDVTKIQNFLPNYNSSPFKIYCQFFSSGPFPGMELTLSIYWLIKIYFADGLHQYICADTEKYSLIFVHWRASAGSIRSSLSLNGKYETTLTSLRTSLSSWYFR